MFSKLMSAAMSSFFYQPKVRLPAEGSTGEAAAAMSGFG